MTFFFRSFLLFSSFFVMLHSLPQNHDVVEGAADIQTSSSSMEITSKSAKTKIHWDAFSINSPENVTFSVSGVQNSDIINIVKLKNPTLISGKLHASSNCRVILVNEHGINIAHGGGIYAHNICFSTLPLIHFDPNNEWIFKGSRDEKIEINGDIQGSEITFIGFYIKENAGAKIVGTSVNIGAGAHVVFKPNHSERIFIASPATHSGGVGADIKGDIEAASLSIKADGSAYALAINHEGMIQATGCHKVNDRIRLIADPQGNSSGGGIELNGKIEKECTTCAGAGSSVEVRGVKILAERGYIKAHGGDVVIGGNRLLSDRSGSVTIDENVKSDQININDSFPISSSTTGANDSASIISIEANDKLILKSDLEAKTLSQETSRINVFCGDYLEFLSNTVDLSSLNDFGTLSIKSGRDLHIVKGANSGISDSTMIASHFGSYLDFAHCTIRSAGAILFKDLVANKNDKTALKMLGEDLRIVGKGGLFRQNGGPIDLDFTKDVILQGFSSLDGFSKIDTHEGDINLSFGSHFQLLGGSGAGSDAFMKARKIYINSKNAGIGDIKVKAGSCSSAYMLSDHGSVEIGKNIMPSQLIIEGGKSGSNHKAYIGNPSAHANVYIGLRNDLTIEAHGGIGNSARIVSDSGTSLIDIDCKSLALKAGVNPSTISGMLSFASIENPKGKVKIKASSDLTLTSSPSAQHKEHSTLIFGEQVHLDVGDTVRLLAGNAFKNDAIIYGKRGVHLEVGKECHFLSHHAASLIKADRGLIKIEPKTLSNLNFSAVASKIAEENHLAGLFIAQGDIHVGATKPLNSLTLQAGGKHLIASEAKIETEKGNININSHKVSVKGGIDGVNSKAHISARGHITLRAKDLSLFSGDHSSSNSHIRGYGNAKVDIQADTVHLYGKCHIPNNASVIAPSPDGHVIVNAATKIIREGNTQIAGGGSTHINTPDHIFIKPCDNIVAPPPGPPGPPGPPNLTGLNGDYFFEIFYRMRYFGFYDWYLLHKDSLWNEADYTAP